MGWRKVEDRLRQATHLLLFAKKRKKSGSTVVKPSDFPGTESCFCLAESLTASSATPTAAAAAFACGVAVAAIDRPISPRFKGHSGRLPTTRTNHRRSLCRSRTVSGCPLVGLFCLTTRLAALRRRVAAFLKERLIGSSEGEVLSTIAAG